MRNWDYRYSWIRDSCFTVRSLAEVGHANEADGFRRFIERTAAGSAEELQILFGVGGERRLHEYEITELEGYRGIQPIRVGNDAAKQTQLDMFGELLDLAWGWHNRGHSPDDDYWEFLVELVNAAAENWRKPDHGIWEMRCKPRHFVLSKAMCWTALDRGIKLAGLLLLPVIGFVGFDDERMIRTTDAIRADLEEEGLLCRYPAGNDGIDAREGAFLPCSFWLVECLARQGRLDQTHEVFERALSTGNDLGLFSEEYDPENRQMLGNFPQGLTHLSLIAAAVALGEKEGNQGNEAPRPSRQRRDGSRSGQSSPT